MQPLFQRTPAPAVPDMERIVDQYGTSLLRLCYLYLKDIHLAEDAVQDVLLKLWGMAAELRSPAAPLAKVLVRNVCVDRLRRCKSKVGIGLADMPAPADEGADGDVFAHVMKVIDTLPAAQQVVLRLRHIDGMPMADIARLTGSSEAAVRKTLSRARMAVRKHLLNDLNDE